MKELCPAEALHEECGVFGIYDSTGKTNMVSAVYLSLIHIFSCSAPRLPRL